MSDSAGMKVNWRRSETISMGTLILVAGWIWWASAKTNSWDSSSTKIAAIEPKVEDHGKQLAVLVAAVQDMKEDVKYIRRHAGQ